MAQDSEGSKGWSLEPPKGEYETCYTPNYHSRVRMHVWPATHTTTTQRVHTNVHLATHATTAHAYTPMYTLLHTRATQN